MATIKQILEEHNILTQVVLTPEIDTLLSMLEHEGEVGPPIGGILTGNVTIREEFGETPIPGFDFGLALPTGGIRETPYKLKLEPTSFKFWLVLSHQGQARFIFKFLEGVPGLALKGARADIDPTTNLVKLEVLKNEDGPISPILVSRSAEPGAALGPALLISATSTAAATIRFTPTTDDEEGIVTIGLEPDTVVFGNSKIGFQCDKLVIDDSLTAKAPEEGAPGINPPKTEIAADQLPWRGLLARQLVFYLPPDVPLFGGTPINGYLAIPTGPGGAQLVIESEMPEREGIGAGPKRPGYKLRIECLDPTAEGLSGLIPTLISATMDLPLDQKQAPISEGQGPITFAAGKPVRLTLTIARDPLNDPGVFKIALALAAQGSEGIISVTSKEGEQGSPAHLFNVAAAMATALIADRKLADQADGSVLLATLAAGGAALSALFEPDSKFVLYGAEIESAGYNLPLGEQLALTLDYSVAVRVTKLEIPGGALSVQMQPEQPMRIRMRRVRMHLDLTKSGLEMIDLDFNRAEMEIENPGAWDLTGLENLFDVLGSRSGRGSTWIEVDLRFKLNLGPISVSNVTIKGTLNSNNKPEVTLTGLGAGLNIPKAIKGEGRVELIPGGFEAALETNIVPLNVIADAKIIYAPPMIVLVLGVDLPAPVPLANSGFGLFGLGGLLGFAAVPNYDGDSPSDPVLKQLQWRPQDENSFIRHDGQSTFGLEAVVGTLPDLGHGFSAKAGLTISVPDVAVRAGLNGRILTPRIHMNEPSYPPKPGFSFLGFMGINSEALSFAVMGHVNLKPLLNITIPIAGNFPIKEDKSDWYLYLGADGAPHEGRQIGPVSARVLPDILDVGADAYLMMRGKGITRWPHGRGQYSQPDGFIVAFGFALQSTFGAVPIVWADIYASLDVLLSTTQSIIAGFGRASGTIHLGPFSTGVEANMKFFAQQQGETLHRYFWAEIIGRIDLIFHTLEDSIVISFENQFDLDLPDPDRHPLDRLDGDNKRLGTLGSLIDDSYRITTEERRDPTTGKIETIQAILVENPSEIRPEMHVWPDTLISLPFAIMPSVSDTIQTRFTGVKNRRPPQKVGSQTLSYEWTLTRLMLVEVTDEADPTNSGTPVSGELAARWQRPRNTDGSGDVHELLLFSHTGELWVNRLGDSGEGMEPKPLQQAAELCHQAVRPEVGWALGADAQPQAGGIYLPPARISANPLISQVKATIHHYGVAGRGMLVPLDEMIMPPLPYQFGESKIANWEETITEPYSFNGHLIAPQLRFPAGLIDHIRVGGWEGPLIFQRQALVIELPEPLIGGMLVLLTPPVPFGEEVTVRDNNDNEWVSQEIFRLQMGEVGLLFINPFGLITTKLSIYFPIDTTIALVGVGGVTLSAQSAATLGQQAITAEMDRQRQAAEDGPKTKHEENVAHQRTILKPGKLYRLDIELEWSGELKKKNAAGKDEVETKSGQKQYLPLGADPTNKPSTDRKLYFRTAASTATGPTPDKQFAHLIYRRQTEFHPQMLQRYLAGYEPAQSELFYFCDDSLRAHFSKDHVMALARAYGFELSVVTHRTDRPGDDPTQPAPTPAIWTFATNPAFLRPADQLRYQYAQTSACTLPTPGATATIQVPLEPEAWYEIYVQATADKVGRLPGVTFRTSRWRDPAQMFAALGWTVANQALASNLVTGDLEIRFPARLSATTITGDQPFEEALQTLNIVGWPVATTVRLSRLWTADDDGSWLFAGLIVESPEPILRPNRVEIQNLALGQTNNLILYRCDRACQRLLYLLASPVLLPVANADTRQLTLTAKSLHTATYLNANNQPIIDKSETLISGLMLLPAMPDIY